ncbi:MAG: hypothetical protein ACKO0Z_25210 [Betaproteobacteria bacterium]
MTDFFNYMPSTATEDEINLARAVCARETVSDSSKLTNSQKWAHVQEVYRKYDSSLYSGIDYEATYTRDNLVECEAASFVADLRAQFLEEILKQEPLNPGAHVLFLLNKTWHVRFRERVELALSEKAMKKMRLT